MTSGQVDGRQKGWRGCLLFIDWQPKSTVRILEDNVFVDTNMKAGLDSGPASVIDASSIQIEGSIDFVSCVVLYKVRTLSWGAGQEVPFQQARFKISNPSGEPAWGGRNCWPNNTGALRSRPRPHQADLLQGLLLLLCLAVTTKEPGRQDEGWHVLLSEML